MMTEVICNAADCYYNKKGICSKDQVFISEFPGIECSGYIPEDAIVE